jgi:molybdopterin/thiamine biosynthesis adenylyltransferase
MEEAMAHLIQVGAGSGGMPVLDLLCHDPRITGVTLIEPDVYRSHNLQRHVFSTAGIGRQKAELAQQWLRERRADLHVSVLPVDILDANAQAPLDQALCQADIGVCAVDTEPAKYRWDELMRRHRLPWTLGEVLSGGIGGFVHWFVPGGPCYGCVASFLQRSVKVEKEKAPDYSDPRGVIEEATVPADIASIHAIAAMHALVTLGLLEHGVNFDPGFTSLLWSLRRVPEVFEEAFRPHRFRVPRAEKCLICGLAGEPATDASGSRVEDLDAALDRALAQLGHA